MNGWRPPFDQLPEHYDRASFQANQDSLKNILPDFMGGRQISVRYGLATVHFAGTVSANSGNVAHGLASPSWAWPGVLGLGNENINAAISIGPTNIIIYLKTIDGAAFTGDVAVAYLIIG